MPPCAPNCTLKTLGCSVDAGRVNCVCANLAGSVADWVPLLPPNTSELYLDKNLLTLVPESSFANLTNLTLISMEDNPFQYVHRGAFEGGKLLAVSFSVVCAQYSVANIVNNGSLSFTACVCMRGTECNATRVQPCSVGHFNQFPYTRTCQPCPLGSAANNDFSEKCDACLPGSYSNYFGAEKCDICPIDRPWSPAGSTSQEDCTVGSLCPTSTRVLG